MPLKKILFADVIREGGSYQASFEDLAGRVITLSLHHSGLRHDAPPHHGYLYVYEGSEMPFNVLPVRTFSEEDRRLLEALDDVLANGEYVECGWNDGSKDTDYYLVRAREIVAYIRKRAPVFAEEIAFLKENHARMAEEIRQGMWDAEHFRFAEPLDLLRLFSEEVDAKRFNGG